MIVNRKKSISRTLLNAAIESARVPMLITDPKQDDNPIVFVNAAFEQLSGYSRRDLLGRNCRILQGPETCQQTVTDIRDSLAAGYSIEKDILNYRKDGSSFWNALFINPVLGDDGRIELFFSAQVDVSDRVRAQQIAAEQATLLVAEVHKYSLVCEQLERAGALSESAARQQAEFVANMSHELRTPLTGILGLHDLLLQSEVVLIPQHRRYLTMAREAGRSLLNVVNDVLDFSKIEAGELTIDRSPFSLSELIGACSDIANETARVKGLSFRSTMHGQDVVLVGDEGRLKQVLTNLITNAIKFTETGGITLDAWYDASTQVVRFEVADTGIGIPSARIPFLFKRFTQVDQSITRRFGGTGLGLAICQRLTSLMNGLIGVESDLGRGSLFWIEVPAELVEAKSRPASRSNSTCAAPQRVLLAEDNMVNQEIIKSMLETHGHEITLVDNGAAAAAAACAAPGFDLILMDVQMPIMDGLSATRAIRVSEQADGRRATPIIGLTANAMSEDVERCLDSGMNDHIAKPIDWESLFSAIDGQSLRQRARAC